MGRFDKMGSKTKKLTFLAISVSLAMILSFVESLIPPLSAVLGVKIGLANTVAVFLLYKAGWKEACVVSLIRVFLSALLFGSFVSLVYSLFGALFSLFFMIISKKLFAFFSPVGISVIGGVMHNVGQILAAVLILENAYIAYYIIPLTVSGTIAGIAIGVLGGILTNRKI